MSKPSLQQEKNSSVKPCLQYDFDQESIRFLDKIKDAGLRVTHQRKTLVNQILNFHRPFSAEDILDRLVNESIDLATIYRSLLLFNKLGFLHSVDFADGVLRYEYISQENHHHHHIVCTDCKSVEPIDICFDDKQEKKIAKIGYVNISHKLMFFGRCLACQKREAESL